MIAQKREIPAEARKHDLQSRKWRTKERRNPTKRPPMLTAMERRPHMTL
jgi:hypothetical protein